MNLQDLTPCMAPHACLSGQVGTAGHRMPTLAYWRIAGGWSLQNGIAAPVMPRDVQDPSPGTRDSRSAQALERHTFFGPRQGSKSAGTDDLGTRSGLSTGSEWSALVESRKARILRSKSVPTPFPKVVPAISICANRRGGLSHARIGIEGPSLPFSLPPKIEAPLMRCENSVCVNKLKNAKAQRRQGANRTRMIASWRPRVFALCVVAVRTRTIERPRVGRRANNNAS